jgi:hypothetical protein
VPRADAQLQRAVVQTRQRDGMQCAGMLDVEVAPPPP